MAGTGRASVNCDVEGQRLVANLAREKPALFDGGEPLVLAREHRATSQVLRLRLGADARAPEAFLKLTHAPPRERERERLVRRMRADFQQQRRAFEAMPEGAYGVARPVGCDPESLFALTEAARGEMLDSALRGGRAGAAVLRRVGAWVRTFHESLRSEGRVSLAEIRRYVDVRLHRALEHGGAFGAEQRRRVLARFDEIAAQVASSDLGAVPIHGDLSLENVIVDGERVTVIDFDVDAGTSGARYHDLAYLYVCLERLKVKPWIRGVAALQRALLEGFEPGLSPSRPLFRLMLLQHVACRLAEGSGQRSPWHEAFDRLAWKSCLRWAGL